MTVLGDKMEGGLRDPRGVGGLAVKRWLVSREGDINWHWASFWKGGWLRRSGKSICSPQLDASTNASGTGDFGRGGHNPLWKRG